MTPDRPISRRPTVAALLAGLTALSFSSVPAVAQGGGGSGQQQGQARMQQLRQIRQQIRQIDEQLRSIQKKAMQDSVLQARQLELQQLIGSAARAADPEFKKKEDRLNELQRELRKAQKNQDTAQVRSLMKEGQKLQRDVRRTQREIMQRDSIQKKIEAYRELQRQKMIEIDPKAEQLLERRDSLMSELRQLSGRGGQQGGGGQGGSGSGGGQGGGR